ncbi:MAG: DUF1572 domain-containing protein [Actinomycetia bacterium]|nr:DUF1572 domain-containing protein [Actinomycetes bacterium]
MSFERQFLEQTNKNINNAFERIIHCLDQLEEEHIWYRPDSDVNSIGIIINHLCGNLRQWIISGIGELQDIRNRPLEFDDSTKLSKHELTNKFKEIINDCEKTIDNFDPGNLLEKRRIQGFDESALSAIYGTVTHLGLHAGQITYITRLILKSNYKLRWIPQTEEEGAE